MALVFASKDFLDLKILKITKEILMFCHSIVIVIAIATFL